MLLIMLLRQVEFIDFKALRTEETFSYTVLSLESSTPCILLILCNLCAENMHVNIMCCYYCVNALKCFGPGTQFSGGHSQFYLKNLKHHLVQKTVIKLTDSIKQNPSWEAKRSSATQEIPRT